MERDGEIDQFQLLEEKVDSLIQFIDVCKREKQSLGEKVRIQERKIAGLTGDMEKIQRAQEKAKQMISSLLAKIEQLEI